MSSYRSALDADGSLESSRTIVLQDLIISDGTVSLEAFLSFLRTFSNMGKVSSTAPSLSLIFSIRLASKYSSASSMPWVARYVT